MLYFVIKTISIEFSLACSMMSLLWVCCCCFSSLLRDVVPLLLKQTFPNSLLRIVPFPFVVEFRIFGLAFWPYLRQIAAVFGSYVKNPLLMFLFLFLIPLFLDRHIPDLVGWGPGGGGVSGTAWSTFQPLKLFILLDEHVHFYIFICSSRYDSLHIFQFIKLLFENRWGFKRAGLITGILSHATNACACDF